MSGGLFVLGYPYPMRPQNLTPTELAELLHRAYLQDLGEDVDEVDMDTRQRLADYLGCHGDASCCLGRLARPA